MKTSVPASVPDAKKGLPKAPANCDSDGKRAGANGVQPGVVTKAWLQNLATKLGGKKSEGEGMTMFNDIAYHRAARLGVLTSLACAGLIAAASAASAQDAAKDYPNRQVKIILTVPAGGGVDSVARIYAEKLRQKWKQTVVIENKGGAAGNLGAEAVANATPDGYTLMASQPAPITVNKFLYKSLKFNPDAIVPIFIMSEIPNVLLVRPDFPGKTVKDFLDYAKANPGKLNYASQGVGTTSHLTAELFGVKAGVKFTHVPYRGTAPALNDLMGSQVDFIFMELSAASELHLGGRARILGIASDHRNKEFPDIPTLIESGVPDFESGTWNALSAPPKTPPEIIAKINADMNALVKEPEMVAQMQKLHLEPKPMRPAQVKAFVQKETVEWGGVIKAAGIPTQ
jgi:tripartite-type tricarboxylate transporter receptor subunit TctC